MTTKQQTTILNSLKTLRASCRQALDGTWDKSDEGFLAMIESINETIETINEIETEL